MMPFVERGWCCQRFFVCSNERSYADITPEAPLGGDDLHRRMFMTPPGNHGNIAKTGQKVKSEGQKKGKILGKTWG